MSVKENYKEELNKLYDKVTDNDESSAKFLSSVKNKFCTFSLPDGIRELANKNILLRSVISKTYKPESTSKYISRLIYEDYKKNMKLYL